MKLEKIKKAQIANEEKQEENQQVKQFLENKLVEMEQLFAYEHQQHERTLGYFYEQEAFGYFESLNEATHIEKQRLFEHLDEGQTRLRTERRHLEAQSETLYEARLNALNEEENNNGQNGDW